MALIINTNIAALNAQRNLGAAQSGVNRAIQRLSTGLRINGAVDDAAGLAISDRLTAQIRGLNQAVRNANDGVSVLQTADGSLNEVSNLLQRARELAIQSANDSNSASDRGSLNSEVKSIIAELDRLANSVQFNSKKLLDGTFSGQQFQVGSNANQTISFSISSINTKDLGATIKVGVAVSSTAFTEFGTLKINGNTVTVGNSTTSIEEVITAINNAKDDTSVTALKNSQTIVTDTGFTSATAGSNQTLTINGVEIVLNTGNADTGAAFKATINNVSIQTGVTVTTSGSNIIFTRASGGDIAISEDSSAAVGVVGDSVASSSQAGRTFNAGFTLTIELGSNITLATGTTSLAVYGNLSSATQTDKKVNDLNISTASGSNDAIGTIDFALDQLNSTRADIGALNNRFLSAISSLQVASENLVAARSRVRDADVAQETAELTRTQILIQAGVAVLAQANQLPAIALTLLG